MRFLFYLSLAGVMYGSLYPFTFVWPVTADIDVFYILTATSKFDVFNNIVLFGPVGILGRLAARSRSQARVLTLLALLTAVLAQVFQVFVPVRYPGILDVLVNTIGYGLGFLVAGWLRGWMSDHAIGSSDLSAPALFLLVSFLAYQLYPYVPAMDVSYLRASVRSTISQSQFPDGLSVLRNGIYWLVVSALLFPMVKKREWRIVLILLPFVIFFLRIIIWRNVPNIWQLSGAVTGMTLYFVLAKTPRLPILLAVTLAALILVQGLTPYYWRHYEASFSWVPFASLLSGSLHQNTMVLAQKIFLYGSLIWFSWQVTSRRVLSAFLVALGLLAIEVTQIFLAAGSPDSSDPILAGLLAIALALMDKTRHSARGQA